MTQDTIKLRLRYDKLSDIEAHRAVVRTLNSQVEKHLRIIQTRKTLCMEPDSGSFSQQENHMNQDTIKDRLRAARALIDKPEKWTQGSMGRDDAGRDASQSGRPVVARCASGAIGEDCGSRGAEWKAVSGQLRKSINRHRFRRGLRNLALTTWNDHPARTHAEVMQAFDRAIGDISTANV